MDLITLITVKLTAIEVGSDSFGNRYYEERKARPVKPPRRYVRYNGVAEASKVPADWHGWLHVEWKKNDSFSSTASRTTFGVISPY